MTKGEIIAFVLGIAWGGTFALYARLAEVLAARKRKQ